MKSLFSRLYWRISTLFMGILLLLGIAYTWITMSSVQRYSQEANQRINRSIAEQIREQIQPMKNGKVDTSSLKELAHYVMDINPDVEIYLLDPQGRILSYVAPKERVELTLVRLGPVQVFLQTEEIQSCILGDDPRNPGKEKVFSAAEVREGGQITGYIYVILTSEQYDSAMAFVMNNYILRVGALTFLVTLLAALVIGMGLIYLLTQNLDRIIATVRHFKEGDLQARMPETRGELRELAQTFNEMADTLVRNIEDLRQVEVFRRELIANVSHDLRTPLSVMRGYVETLLMKEENLSEKAKGYLQTLLESNEKLEKLVGDLFAFSKLEAQQVVLRKEPFSLPELVQDICQQYQLLAEQKGVELTWKQEPGLPMVEADISLIERVLQNLIDNALKFTPEGGKVTLSIRRGTSGVEVEVSDTGAGIPEAELPFVFDRYHKGSGGGTGLGLAIVKKILALHEAPLGLYSEAGRGTSIRFELPG